MKTQTTKQSYPRVALNLIDPDPNNPRKFFDQAKIIELKESILQVDVLQPVTLRDNKKKPGRYLLVFGERRYRASLLAQKEKTSIVDIPAIVAELTDEQALKLQIIENVQREEVAPMDEAAGFKQLRDKYKMTDGDISAEVGKSKHYVRQRIKLMDLIPPVQKALFERQVKHSDCLRMAQLSPESQQLMWNKLKNSWHFRNKEFPVTIDPEDFDTYSGELSSAGFPLDAGHLGAVACTVCPNNTANNSLFPEDVNQPRCINVACLKVKTDKWLSLQMDIFQDDPRAVMISTQDYCFANDGKVKEIRQKMNTPVYLGKQFGKKILQAPVAPVRSAYDAQSKFDEDITRYEKDLAKYNDEFAKAKKYVRALIVDGDKTGSWALVKLDAEKSAAVVTEGTPVQAVMQAEGIKLREKRKQELDEQKMHERVQHMMLTDSDYVDGDAPAPIEVAVCLYLMWKDLNDQQRNKINKLFSLGIGEDFYDDEYNVKYFRKIEAVAYSERCKEFGNVLMRAYILTKSEVREATARTSAKALGLMMIADYYYPDDTKAIYDEINSAAAARTERTNERLRQLTRGKQSSKSKKLTNGLELQN